MPELPEVECWGRRVAENAIGGKRIKSVFVKPDEIVFAGTTAAKFAKALRGRTVQACRRVGKQMWWELDGEGPMPLLHFGMTGRFHVYRGIKERPGWLKFEVTAEDGTRLAMTDKRRFARIQLRDDPANEKPLAVLGPDALDALPGLVAWREQLARRKTPIKALLLNQSFVAGIGNWIADEVLYQAKVDPRRVASDLSDEEAKAVRAKTLHVLRQAVRWEADYKRFSKQWLFLHRWQKRESEKQIVADAKGRPIQYDTVGGRTTAWVPGVQT